MTPSRLATAIGLGSVGAATAPALSSIGPLRRGLTPRLSGISPARHVALTFDDGPDPASTPLFLDLLAHHHRRATFFVLGAHAFRHASLLHRVAAEGHEVAIHGWTHRCTAVASPAHLARELRAARQEVEEITGTPVTWYRPPYGVLTTQTVLVCRGLTLTPVLWSAWGREWERRATPHHITESVLRTLRPGGTILLHDTDRHMRRGDWRRTLRATAALLAGPLATATVGPLGEHWDHRV